MRRLTCLIAAGMFAVAPFCANAAAVAYGEAYDTLYQIDLASHQATAVGTAGSYGGVPIANISGLTTLSDGTQYAVWGAYKLLLKINPSTGAATVVGSLGLAGLGSSQFDPLDLGMTADCNDTLWLSSGTLQRLWTVNKTTGATTPVGSTGHPVFGLIAGGDTLYGTGSRGDHGFYRIDKTSGAATQIGTFGPTVSNQLSSVSMAFDATGTLWAVLNYVPPYTGNTPDWNDLATIDPSSGAMTVLGPITGPDSLRQIGMKGFTNGPAYCPRSSGGGGNDPLAAPIDAPWALALMGMLLAGAGALSRRRAMPKA